MSWRPSRTNFRFPREVVSERSLDHEPPWIHSSVTVGGTAFCEHGSLTVTGAMGGVEGRVEI